MSYAIEFNGVEKAFGSFKALNGLNLKINEGQVTSLLGPNGAGKTTAVSLMLHLLKPTSGEIKVLGMEPKHPELRQKVGALLQETKPADGLKVGEILQLFRSYYRDPLSYETLLDLSGLHREANRKAASLSGGQRRRLAFAQSMAGNPSLLLLDEPTTGMDVEARIRFWEVIRALASDRKTIVLTTHHLEEADSVSDQIAVISEGRLLAEGTSDSLKSGFTTRFISFRADNPPKTSELQSLPGVERVEQKSGYIILHSKETDALLTFIMNAGWGISNIQVSSATLEDAFRSLTAPVENKAPAIQKRKEV
ncbi:ABC transporter ATP-binding protein [Bacillus sp. M6-12]|nr:ABC transporter ATP-binding protein [Bacillus sp. M6-12]